jgi:hypothetical protein
MSKFQNIRNQITNPNLRSVIQRERSEIDSDEDSTAPSIVEEESDEEDPEDVDFEDSITDEGSHYPSYQSSSLGRERESIALSSELSYGKEDSLDVEEYEDSEQSERAYSRQRKDSVSSVGSGSYFESSSKGRVSEGSRGRVSDEGSRGRVSDGSRGRGSDGSRERSSEDERRERRALSTIDEQTNEDEDESEGR